MSTVSQRIPTFLLGISQQSDNKKVPGQVNDAINVFPDFVNGLVKRPGSSFIGELVNAGTNTSNQFWFDINRDDTEKYVGQYDITAKQFKVWKHAYPTTSVGVFDQPELLEVKAVQHFNGASAYTTSYETQANNYNTSLQNLQAKLGLLNAAQYDYKKKLLGQSSSVAVLFEVNETYGNQGDLVQSLKSGAIKLSSGVVRVYNNGTLVQASTTLPSGYALGNERTDEYPLMTRAGERVYEVERTIAAAYTAAQLSAALSAMNTAQTNYDTALSSHLSYKTSLATAINNNNNLVGGAYLSTVTSPADISVLNIIDKTFVINKKVTPALKADLSPAYKIEAFIILEVLAPETNLVVQITWRDTGNVLRSFNYQVYVNPGAPDAEYQLTQLVNLINNGGNGLPGTSASGSGTSGHEITARKVGNGIYLSRPSSGGNYGGKAFDIEVSGGQAQNCLFAFQQTINNSAKLPNQCVDGYLCKVANSESVDADDYYVKFVCDSTETTEGPGSWEETIKPAIKYKIDPATMPHELIRKTNGHFELKPAEWEDRLIGDDKTNPIPTFIGEPIQGAFFYRNRLGFLAGQALVLSRANDFYNFFNKTALTVSDDDPIDIDCTSTKPQILRYVVPQATGLTIFGQGEQFLLSTDTDVLSPKSAKVNRLSNFSSATNVAPIDTGIGIGFLARAGSSTRHFELLEVSQDRSAKAVETSLPVSDLLPYTIDIYKNESNLSFLFLGEKNSSNAFIYRYLQIGDKRNAEGWFKWSFKDKLQHIYFDEGRGYAVLQDSGNRLYLGEILLQQFSDFGDVRSNIRGAVPLPGSSNKVTDVKLDKWYSGVYRSYNSATDETTIKSPYRSFDSVVLFENLNLDAENKIGGEITQAQNITVTSTTDANGFGQTTLQGDHRDKFIYVGDAYTMSVELPRAYMVGRSGEGFQTDTNANLIVHRLKINTGFTGPLKYQIKIAGRTDYEEYDAPVFPPIYAGNSIPVSTEGQHTIPVQQRNDNYTVTLIGDTPYPVTLQSYDWEGRYTTNFYQRRPY